MLIEGTVETVKAEDGVWDTMAESVGFKSEIDATLDALIAADVDTSLAVTVNEFVDAGEFETVFKEERDMKADNEALTLRVIPVLVAKTETLTLLVIPVLVAKTETDAENEKCCDTVAIPDVVAEIEGDELTDTEGEDLAEVDDLTDIEGSNDVKPDSVGNFDGIALIVILEGVSNAENDVEPVLDLDFDA